MNLEHHLSFLEEVIQHCEQDQINLQRKNLRESFNSLEACLREFQQQTLEFREILDHLHDGIYIVDGKGNTVFINKAYTRITGITPDMVSGRKVQEILKEGRLFKNAVSGEVIREKKRVDAIGESLLNHQKMLITGTPIFDTEGEVKKVVVNNRALTDLEEIQSQLENTKDKLRIYQEENIKKDQELSHFRRTQIDAKDFIGECPELLQIKTTIRQIAPTDASVLITGPTGTGKEVVAREIVRHSRRQTKPFIKINCSAIPENLLESELFGYDKGSFTGASREGKPGLFEIANHGTLLLDEIGDMPMSLQCKLLRVLQEKEVKRIGSHTCIPVDVRILSATNKNLKQSITQGDFREDLYYRLNLLPVHLPPLRERGDDIISFRDAFLARYNQKYSKTIEMAEKTMALLKAYAWPGNIREFKNTMERLVIVSHDSQTAHDAVVAMLGPGDPLPSENSQRSYKEIIQDYERQILSKAMDKYKTTTNAAKHLQLDQSTIVKKRKKLGIS